MLKIEHMTSFENPSRQNLTTVENSTSEHIGVPFAREGFE